MGFIARLPENADIGSDVLDLVGPLGAVGTVRNLSDFVARRAALGKRISRISRAMELPLIKRPVTALREFAEKRARDELGMVDWFEKLKREAEERRLFEFLRSVFPK